MSTSMFQDFNQKDFIMDVFDFMNKHKISNRKFHELTGISYMTLYRTLKKKTEIKLSTIIALQKFMKDYDAS